MSYRLFLGFILPPLLGSILLSLMMVFAFGFKTELSFVIIFIANFLLVGAQSFLYSLIMEFIVNRLVQSSFVTVLISGAFGFFSATGISLFYVLANPNHEMGNIGTVSNMITSYDLTGIFTGLITGYVLRKHYIKHLPSNKISKV